MDGQIKDGQRIQAELGSGVGLDAIFVHHLPSLESICVSDGSGKQTLPIDLCRSVATLRGEECTLEAQLMNGCSGYLAQSLDDFTTKKAGAMKNSRVRYDHAMNDYGVALVSALSPFPLVLLFIPFLLVEEGASSIGQRA